MKSYFAQSTNNKVLPVLVSLSKMSFSFSVLFSLQLPKPSSLVPFFSFMSQGITYLDFVYEAFASLSFYPSYPVCCVCIYMCVYIYIYVCVCVCVCCFVTCNNCYALKARHSYTFFRVLCLVYVSISHSCPLH